MRRLVPLLPILALCLLLALEAWVALFALGRPHLLSSALPLALVVLLYPLLGRWQPE